MDGSLLRPSIYYDSDAVNIVVDGGLPLFLLLGRYETERPGCMFQFHVIICIGKPEINKHNAYVRLHPELSHGIVQLTEFYLVVIYHSAKLVK